jgi:hypothetical protein
MMMISNKKSATSLLIDTNKNDIQCWMEFCQFSNQTKKSTIIRSRCMHGMGNGSHAKMRQKLTCNDTRIKFLKGPAAVKTTLYTQLTVIKCIFSHFHPRQSRVNSCNCTFAQVAVKSIADCSVDVGCLILNPRL